MRINRAQGCLLGQLCGDALGSLVEFQTPEQILQDYPEGVRNLAPGGTWNTLAGQPTDDSEMALLLARLLIEDKSYNTDNALKAYQYWLSTAPFDCGMTIAAALQGRPNVNSQANGALMRISPLAIFGANHTLTQVAQWAQNDAALTHPNPLCQQANALFAMALATAIDQGPDPHTLYQNILEWATDMQVAVHLMDALRFAAEQPPQNYLHQQGWVLIALQNALWQLLHASNLEQGIIDTVMRGGDTDTNATICGALLGAVYGLQAIPVQWVEQVLDCRPQAGMSGVHRPRPQTLWPIDALVLAEQLISA